MYQQQIGSMKDIIIIILILQLHRKTVQQNCTLSKYYRIAGAHVRNTTLLAGVAVARLIAHRNNTNQQSVQLQEKD